MLLPAAENQLFWINLGVLGLNFGLFFWIWSRYRSLDARQKYFDREYEHMLLEGRKKAAHVSTVAMEKSQTLLQQTELQAHAIAQDFVTHLQKVHVAYAQSLQKQFPVVEKTYVQFLDSHKQQVAAKMISEMNTITEEGEKVTLALLEAWKKRTLEFEKHFETQLQDKLKEIDREIERYGESQKNAVNKQLGLLVTNALRDILSREIPADLHEKLVVELIKKAKKDGVFHD